MTVSVHNPDQYMASLRQIIAQGRKRIGLLVRAGAPAGIFPPGSDKPLIPAVAGLTDMVFRHLRLRLLSETTCAACWSRMAKVIDMNGPFASCLADRCFSPPSLGTS